MKLNAIVFLALLLMSLSSDCLAGTLKGTVKRLDNAVLANVQIVVVDLETKAQLAVSQSGDDGSYTVTFPDTAQAVSITFTNGGRNEPAALIGVPGSIVANDFAIFMPNPKTIDCPKPHCCKPTCCRKAKHSRLCRR